MQCRCGKSVVVPRLSDLRKSAGESPYRITTIERIRRMIDEGQTPCEEICPLTGLPANETVLLHVQCERTWVRRGEAWSDVKTILFTLCLGWIGLLIACFSPGSRQEFGRNTSLELPLRIASEALPELRRMRRQKALKALLSTSPVYAQLLDEFPEARVAVVDAAAREPVKS